MGRAIRAVRYTAATLLAAQIGVGELAAQATTVVTSSIGCPACRIDFVKKVTLGAPTDTVSPSDFQTGVIRDSRGRYYVAPAADLVTIAVYDSAGRFLRTFGRGGKGPGEYGYVIRAEVLPGDSLLVIDGAMSRLTVLSPSYGVVRTTQTNGRFTRAFPLADGRLIVNGTVRTRAAAGLPLHVLGSDGTVLRSFGSLRPETRRDRPQADIRWAEMTSTHEVWTARLDRYEVELWNIDGTRIRSFRRDADWFQPWDYSTAYRAEAPPRPMTVAIWPDSAGRVWTMVHVPSADWKPPPRVTSAREQPVPPFDVKDGNTDTIVEVFDPKTGVLLASQRFPQYFVGNVGRDAVYSLRATDDGDLRIDVWQVRLAQR